MKQLPDDHFGSLLWDEDFGEWQGSTNISPHGEVDIGLPPEYIEVSEIRLHILATIELIKRNELGFRERAAHDLYTRGGYAFFILKNQQFNHEEFVNNMHLAVITFDTDFPDLPLTLNYEYGDEGIEHGIFIALTWDGAYHSVQAY